MYYFCTYFDHRFLNRGLALYMSLQKHCASFKLWVLCLDDICYDILSKLRVKNIQLISLEDFEKNDEELLRAKQNRTFIEYYFTCTPSLPLYIFKNQPEIGFITYLDADLFFFSDPQPIYDEIGDSSIGIIEHRFPPALHNNKRYGIFNVGWVSFRRDETGLKCLKHWRNQCISWCYDRVEDGRYADQKYLDEWPLSFSNIKIISHLGANLAPWNLSNYNIHKEGNTIWVDKYPLIFYHFHRIWSLNRWLYDLNLDIFGAVPSLIVRRDIYRPYIKELLTVNEDLSVISSSDLAVANKTIRTIRDNAFPRITLKKIYKRAYLVVI